MKNEDVNEITVVGKDHVIKYSDPDEVSHMVDGITMVLPKKSKGKLSCAIGTKFYLKDGTEIKDISSFEIKPTGCDNILTVTLTLPLSLVVYGE